MWNSWTSGAADLGHSVKIGQTLIQVVVIGGVIVIGGALILLAISFVNGSQDLSAVIDSAGNAASKMPIPV